MENVLGVMYNPHYPNVLSQQSPAGHARWLEITLQALDGEAVIAFADAAQWESWLAEHHQRATGVWVKIAKKRSAKTSVTLAEALDVALCYGWIDSQRKPYDDDRYLQRYSPRRRTSPWSRINVEKAELLVAAGRMREHGLGAIEAAKADGRFGPEPVEGGSV